MPRKLNLISKGLSIAVLMLVPSFTAFADASNKNRENIGFYMDSAAEFCGGVDKEGYSTTGTLSGEAKAEADNILKKFANLGISLNGTTQREEFYNVLQDDLTSVINRNTECKETIFKTLIDKFPPDSSLSDNEPVDSLDTEESSEDIEEEDDETQNPPTDISAKKLNVSSVEVNNENEYGRSYTALNITDGNNQSYWCSKSGSIFDVVLDFYFDEPKSISQINLFSPKDGSSYTQPIEVELVFLNDSGEVITSQTITLKGSLDEWQEYDLKKVDNVSRVTMDLGEPKNNTAQYLTFNEIRLYGYE